MTLEEIKNNFSQNLIKLRKSKNLTQAQLAEKLNYSDKAISKWEVGSVLPDVETLSHIADYFGLTVNDLIYKKKESILRYITQNHLFTTLASIGLLWFLSTIVYFVISITTDLTKVWLTFIFTIPLTFVLLLVFSCLWFKKIWVYISLSGIFWGIIISIYLAISNFSLWFLFVIGVAGQIFIFLTIPIGKHKHKQ